MESLTKPEREELRNVRQNAPLFPGDTISHATARSLRDKGLIVRNAEGYWIPKPTNPPEQNISERLHAFQRSYNPRQG